ncbi:unnamed protein product [Urochloa humidicola]
MAAEGGDRSRAEGAPAVGDKVESRGFNWAAFFRNRYVMLQIILYAFLFYRMMPSHRELGPFLVWILILVPQSIANVIGTHILMESASKHGIKLKRPWPAPQIEEMVKRWFK